jgi:chromosome partitioning protein
MQVQDLLGTFYQEPSLEHLRQLSNQEFDSLLIHIFKLAGYEVNRGDASLYLAYNNRVIALVMYSYAAQVNVGSGLADSLRQARDNSGIDAAGIGITRTSFISPTLNDPRITLINGDQLLRYFDFLRGSRLENARMAPLSPDFLPFVDEMRSCFDGKPNVIAITNNRGGIGKSTTAMNLAYGLASKGKTVLAIDLDAQANFTEMLGGRVSTLANAHIGRHFAGMAELAHLIQPTPFPLIKYIPAHPDMRKVALGMELWPMNHFQFASLLRSENIANHPLAGTHGFDWIVIDTPPDMGFYSQAAIVAANYMLAPTFPSLAGNGGIKVLSDTAKTISKLTNKPNHARFLGFIATCYSGDKATGAMKADYAQLQDRVADMVGKEAYSKPQLPLFLSIEIPETPKIVTATRDLIKTTQQGNSFPLFLREGEGRKEAGTAYQKLIEEVLIRANNS